MVGSKKRVALVYGNLPTVEEIDQFMLIADEYDLTVISSESICGYLTQNSYFHNLPCIALADYEENTTYLPGLENALRGFDLVIIKERLGMYAYQAVKAKWRNRFRLICWVDNAVVRPGEDVTMMRTVRSEVTSAADGFIVQSEAVRSALEIEGIEQKRIMSFPPWVETRVKRSGKNRAQALQKLGLSDTDFVICHFGQIEWEESLVDLLNALKMMQSTDKNLAARLKVVLCGIGSYGTELRDRAVQMGLDRQFIYVAPTREALETTLTAADCMYYGLVPARDRIDAEPYRIISAMTVGLPLLAPRNILVQEFAGKHRIDFCSQSITSLVGAITKVAYSKVLRNDVARKCQQSLNNQKEKAQKEMREIFSSVHKLAASVDANAIDHQVIEVESLINNKQYVQAIDIIESIFKIPNIPLHHRANLLRLIGDSFTKLGDGDAGKNAYQQSIEIDSYAPKTYIGLGTVALTKQNYESAVIQFQKAVSLAPDDEMASLGLGLAFQGMGEFNEASNWVVKSLEMRPENTVALYTLVQIAHELHNYSEAEKALSRYMKQHPGDHNMLYTLGAIRFKAGMMDEALEIAKELLRLDPYNERAISLRDQVQRSLSSKAETLNG